MSKFRTISDAGKADPSRIKLVKGPNGRNLCRFCKTEVTPPRRTFCSGEKTQYSRRKINGVWTAVVYKQGFGCVHEWCLRNWPKYARNAVFDRDQGVCALCGVKHIRKGPWQADHIVPVVEGGGECGLDNLRTLCVPCHKKVTKELRGRLAAKRKQEKVVSGTGNADTENCNKILSSEEKS